MTRVPLIQFRYGKRAVQALKHATSSSAPSKIYVEPVDAGPLKKGVSYSFHKSFITVPAQYNRAPIKEDEMEIIQSGGVPFVKPQPAKGGAKAKK
ncbi:ribosomal protein mS36 [Acrasis kona]|uniref:Ribosomal protein mS36 n=1 Tax=Acrasis kona TaxID=1008807 RepID=A0AAW2YUJ4_9EUKA